MTDFDELLIFMVKDIPAIYDKTEKDFKNEMFKREKWRGIASMISEVLSKEFSDETCKRRWLSLRDTFVREHRKLKTPTPSGSAAGDKLVWPLYNTMEFLIPHMQHRRTKSSFTVATCSQEECVDDQMSLLETGSDVSQDVDNPPPVPEDGQSEAVSIEAIVKRPRKVQSPQVDASFLRRKKAVENDESSFIAANAAFVSTVNAVKDAILKKQDSEDVYMGCIRDSLKRVPPSARTRCIIDILEVVAKYEES